MVNPTSAQDLIGAQVGLYRVQELIGEGGMAQVYRGTDAAGEAVAIKVARRDLARDGVFRRRFEREGRIARQVVSAHLVPVIDAGEDEGVPYLVQRLMPGLVHRDVKPPNVLIDAAGRSLLADFGLVRDSRGTVLTRVGQALGSPHYMAPEQIRGEEVTAAAVLQALAKDVEQRPGDALAYVATLCRAAGTEPARV